MAATTASGSWSTSTTQGCSSGSGSWKSANWLSSNRAGKKWPWRAISRDRMSCRAPCRYTRRTSGRPPSSRSRWARLSAEQETTAGCRAAICRSIHVATAVSQGCLSSSLSASPAAILARFAGVWKSSASLYAQPSRSASSRATVDLPDPDTPVTSTTAGGTPAATMHAGSGGNPSVGLPRDGEPRTVLG